MLGPGDRDDDIALLAARFDGIAPSDVAYWFLEPEDAAAWPGRRGDRVGESAEQGDEMRRPLLVVRLDARRAGGHASLVPARPAGLCRRLRHPPDPAAPGQPRGNPAALDRSARAAAHRLQFLFRAGRSPAPARGVQARARRRLSAAARPLSRPRGLARRKGEIRCRDRCLHPPDRDHRASPLRHLRHGHRARCGHRSAVARARGRAPSRGRRFRHA